MSPNVERDAEIYRLRAEGLPYRVIGEKFGISYERVRQILHKAGKLAVKGRYWNNKDRGWTASAS